EGVPVGGTKISELGADRQRDRGRRRDEAEEQRAGANEDVRRASATGKLSERHLLRLDRETGHREDEGEERERAAEPPKRHKEELVRNRLIDGRHAEEGRAGAGRAREAERGEKGAHGATQKGAAPCQKCAIEEEAGEGDESEASAGRGHRLFPMAEVERREDEKRDPAVD